MSSVVIAGDTSGTVTLAAPAVSGTTTLTLPTTSGTIVTTSGAQTIEFADGSASTPSITNSGDTNTGIFFPAADTIAFAEGGAEAMRLTDTGLLQFNSGYGSVATAYGCRAWVNFNGTGTVAIRASGNVSSITDNGTGNYTVNLTTAMPDENYSAQASFQTTGVGTASNIFSSSFSATVAPATTSYRLAFWATANGVGVDPAYVCSAIFR